MLTPSRKQEPQTAQTASLQPAMQDSRFVQ